MTDRAQPETQRPDPWTRALLAVLLVALAVRLAAGASAGLFLDEIYTVQLARAPVADIVAHGRSEPIPPGYYLFMKPLAEASHSPLFLRMPALLFSVGVVGLTFLAGRRLAGPAAGLAAAALLAAAHPVWLAEAQVRMYALVALLDAAAFSLWLRQERTRAETLLYLATCLALPLVHYLGNLTLAVLAASSRSLRSAGPPLLGLAAGGLWLAFALGGGGSVFPERHPPPFLWSLLTLPAWFLGATTPTAWPGFRGTEPPGEPVTALLAGVFGALGWAAAARGTLEVARVDRRAAGTLAALVLVPTLALFGGAWLGLQMFQHRYLAPYAFAFDLLAAAGLLRWRLAPAVALLVGVNLVTAAVFPGDPYLWNQDWSRPAAFIRERAGPEAVVAAHTPFALLGFNDAYAPAAFALDFGEHGAVPRYRFTEDYRGPAQVGIWGPEALEGGLRDFLQGRQVLLLINQPRQPQAGAILDWFLQRYRAEAVLEVPSLHDWGRIQVYDLRPLSTTPSPPRP